MASSLAYNSDLPLRPDISLILPSIAILTNNPYLFVFSSAFQAFKWQSGCDCFVKLCHRKRLSIRLAPVILATTAVLYALGVSEKVVFAVGALIAGSTMESIDTKVVKMFCFAACYCLDTIPAVIACLAITIVYSYFMGWKLRVLDSKEIFGSNQYWILRRDFQLARRINAKGEYHLEYRSDDGNIMLVGDGRLIRSGSGMKNGLNLKQFADKDREVWGEAVSRGMVTEHDGVVDLK